MRGARVSVTPLSRGQGKEGESDGQ